MIDMDLRTIARALGGTVCNGEVLAPGPEHSRVDRSLSVRLDRTAPDGFIVHSFAKDDPIVCRDYVREKCGLPAFGSNRNDKPTEIKHAAPTRRVVDDSTIAAALAAIKTAPPKQNGKIVATYDYTDNKGDLLYQVLRYEPKTFRQRRPDGKGGWIKNVEGCGRVLYRLPELLKYPDACVFVCEGEKDADRVASLDHCATTVACGDWTEDCVKALAGRDCFVLEDNDEAGRKKAQEAAQALHGTAKTVRIVRLPNLPEKGDVSDWLDADPRNASKLADVCFDAPLWIPNTPASSSSSPSPSLSLPWINMSKWDHEPMPERQWAIYNRVPLNQAGLFSGEGGAGKSIVELMKDVAHVTGKDWFGSMPEQGPAFYISAEDDETENHIRLANITDHYGVTFDELIAKGFRALCLLGQDATLCAVSGKSGKVEVTDLYRRLHEAAGDLKPKNISIDTLSRAFAGNEIDRVQVYAFAMHMQALAMVAGGSVTVLSHPSLQGIASGSGISGSTAWHGAFRFRQYLTSVKPDGGEQPDDDLRELQFKKNQYGPKAETVVVRYQRGLFLPVPGVGSLEKVAQEQQDDEAFLAALDQVEQQGRHVSDRVNANNYAPTSFNQVTRIPKARLAAAMERLFTAGKIQMVTYGPPSKAWRKLARKT